jgi:hypothetical protein
MREKLYLSSGDYTNLQQVRTIRDYSWGSIDDKDSLIVDIDIGIEDPRRSDSKQTITRLHLLPRFIEHQDPFKKLKDFPFYVHVLTPKIAIHKDRPTRDDFYNVAWAELYDNLEEAEDPFNPRFRRHS